MRRQRRSATQEILRRETKGWSGGGEGAPRWYPSRESGGRRLRGGRRQGKEGPRQREEGGETGNWGDWGRSERRCGRPTGEGPQVRGRCVGPRRPRDSESKPRNGPGEEWIWPPQANAVTVAPTPAGARPPQAWDLAAKGLVAKPVQRGVGFGSCRPTPVARADSILVRPGWGFPSSLPCQGLSQAVPRHPWELGEGGAVLGEPKGRRTETGGWR